MPNPDMITQYLASRGAAPSAENASRVRQHYASNPDLLDRRALGLPGGLDDNSAVLDAMLDKHIAESMPAPAGQVTVGEPEKIGNGGSVPPPDKRGPAVKGPSEVGGTKATGSRQGEYGPGPSPSRQANYGPGAKPAPSGMVDESGMPVSGESETGGIGKFLLSLLGAGSAAGFAGMKPNAAAATPNAPPLPGSVPPGQQINATTGAPREPMENMLDSNRARLQAEIDAENDAMYRQMEEQARIQRNQRNAEETARAARRATGRR
jgi:hypothetical protein